MNDRKDNKAAMSDKDARLRQALKANLQRRKQQARARTADRELAGDTGDSSGNEEQKRDG